MLDILLKIKEEPSTNKKIQLIKECSQLEIDILIWVYSPHTKSGIGIASLINGNIYNDSCTTFYEVIEHLKNNCTGTYCSWRHTPLRNAQIMKRKFDTCSWRHTPLRKICALT